MPALINDAGDILVLGENGQLQRPPMAQNPETGDQIYLDGKEWKPVATLKGRQANNQAGAIDNIARTLARGATLGYMDELAAAGNATFGLGAGGGEGSWSDRYDRALAAERGRDDAYDRDHPVLSTAGQIVGGVGSAAALPLAAPFGRSATGVRALGNTAANSGIYGSVAGFGEGRGGLANRIESGALGGAVGAGVGTAAHLLLGAASSVGGKIANLLGVRDPERSAERQMVRALMRDDITPEELARRAATATPETIIPDIAGRSTTNLTAVAANTPGRAMEAIDNLTMTRRLGAPDRIAAAVDETLGGGAGTDVAEAMARLQTERAARAAPLYERAFAHPVDIKQAKQVNRFVTDPIGQNALQEGMRIIELEHLAARKIFDPERYGVTRSKDSGKWIIDPDILDGKKAPSFRLMDAVKRGFDEIVEGFRDPTTGRLTLNQYGRAVNDVRAEYRNTLARLNPAYDEALKAWSGPSASMDAIRRGAQSLRVDRDKTATIADRVSEADQPFLQLGMGRAITDMTSDPRSAPGQARRLVEDRQMQARLASVVPDEPRQALIAALTREMRQADIDRTISPRAGSQTMRLMQGADDMGNDVASPMLQSLLSAAQHNGPWGLAMSGLRNLYSRGQGMNSATVDALTPRLTAQGPEEIGRVARSLQQRAIMDTMERERRAAIARLLLTGTSTGAALGAN